MKIRVIVNPSAAAGSAGKKIPRLLRLLRSRGLTVDIVTTNRRGDATALALASPSDVDVLGVMGGDGTFNEVAQAFLGQGPKAAFRPNLAFIPAGTGGDLKRSLGLTNDLEAAADRIANARCSPMDLGSLLQSDAAAITPVAFLNVASFGLSARVCALANGGSKWLGGKLTFYGAALRATFSHRNVGVRVKVDGAPLYEGLAYLVAIANGSYFGGGMKIAPSASVNDGLLDVVVLGDYSKLGAVSLSRAIYAGTHIRRDKTHARRGRVVEVEALEPAENQMVETDGELPPLRLPIRAELLPAALRVCR